MHHHPSEEELHERAEAWEEILAERHHRPPRFLDGPPPKARSDRAVRPTSERRRYVADGTWIATTTQTFGIGNLDIDLVKGHPVEIPDANALAILAEHGHIIQVMT